MENVTVQTSTGGRSAGATRVLMRTVLVIALLVLLAVAGWLVLDPSDATPHKAVLKTASWLQDRGVPARVADGDLIEFCFNIALFVPLGLVGSLLWRRPTVLGWVGIGLVLSSSIETVQLLLLPGRSGSLLDVVANTTGTLIGALVAHRLRRTVRE